MEGLYGLQTPPSSDARGAIGGIARIASSRMVCTFRWHSVAHGRLWSPARHRCLSRRDRPAAFEDRKWTSQAEPQPFRKILSGEAPTVDYAGVPRRVIRDAAEWHFSHLSNPPSQPPNRRRRGNSADDSHHVETDRL